MILQIIQSVWEIKFDKFDKSFPICVMSHMQPCLSDKVKSHIATCWKKSNIYIEVLKFKVSQDLCVLVYCTDTIVKWLFKEIYTKYQSLIVCGKLCIYINYFT